MMLHIDTSDSRRSPPWQSRFTAHIMGQGHNTIARLRCQNRVVIAHLLLQGGELQLAPARAPQSSMSCQQTPWRPSRATGS